MSNWANKGKAAIKAVPTVNKAPRSTLEGDRQAIIQSAEPKTYSTGAFGVKVTYALTGSADNAGRKVFENLILTLKTGKENPTGLKIMQERLSAAGLSSEEILNFAYPTSDTDFGDLGKIVGKAMVLLLDSSEMYEGKPQTRVRATAPVSE